MFCVVSQSQEMEPLQAKVYYTQERGVCSNLSQVVPVSTRKGQKVTKTAQVKSKSQQEPNAGFTNAAASEPLKEMCLVLTSNNYTHVSNQLSHWPSP